MHKFGDDEGRYPDPVRAWYNDIVPAQVLLRPVTARAVTVTVAVIALLAACSSGPRTRDCFRTRSQLAFAPPAVPDARAPADSLADIVELIAVGRGLVEPMALAQPPGESERLYIAERGGRIVIVFPGDAPFVFADLSDRVITENRDQGLLGFVFHPEFQANKRVYVTYTGREDGATYVMEFRVDRSNPDLLDLSSGRQIIRLGQPWPERNGGHLAFGKDGYLYIGTADGGGRGDPRDHAQRCDSWRGKMLRIDVDAEAMAVEVIQMGLRNPWRYSFDRKTGDLYVGDAGASSWGLLYALSSTDLEGHNFGWNIATGARCTDDRPCDRSGFTVPVLEYDRSVGCAIVGGHVYRGSAIPELDGAYFYGDYCSGALRSVRWKNRQLSEHLDWKTVLDPRGRVTRIRSFAQDQAGELYILVADGIVYKLQRKAVQ